MKNIWNIVKKELDKIFKSPRLIISTFLLPGLLIFVMYSFMGSSAKSQNEKTLTHEYNIVLIQESEEIKKLITTETVGFTVNITTYETSKSYETLQQELSDANSQMYREIQESIKNEETDLWILPSSNFDNVVTKVNNETAQVVVYQNSMSQFSSVLATQVQQILQATEASINPHNLIIQTNVLDIVSDKDSGSMMLAMMAPMLIMTFIFAGALSIGADSIAGEKERGTISTMLMAPISKNHIVLGKIISAIIITIIASIFSFLGLMAALNQFMAVLGTGGAMSLNLNFATTIQLLVMILLISLIAVSLFLVASTYAKSTKEATMYAMPVYILGIVCGVFSMYSTSLPSNLGYYIIPIYNLNLGLKGIFIDSLSTMQFLAIVGSNLVYFVIILFAVRKMFNSEKIMFAK